MITFVENIRKFAVFNAGNGNIRIPEMLNGFKIKIPSLENQQKVIQEIEKIESEQTLYANYAKVLKEQIDNMNITIKNICNIKNKVENESETESSDEKPKNKKKKKVENDSDSYSDSDYEKEQKK